MIFFRVVETDNFGGDYPNESFHGPCCRTKTAATGIAEACNSASNEHSIRYYKVVELPYALQPGFEPQPL